MEPRLRALPRRVPRPATGCDEIDARGRAGDRRRFPDAVQRAPRARFRSRCRAFGGGGWAVLLDTARDDGLVPDGTYAADSAYPLGGTLARAAPEGAAVKRAHRMPLRRRGGAQGRAFRLWAPGRAQRGARARHGSRRGRLPMPAAGGGWFAADVADAPAGTRYAFRIDGGLAVPDPASRANPDGVHAASEVVDPEAYAWQDAGWRGRPWHEAVDLRAARRHVHAARHVRRRERAPRCARRARHHRHRADAGGRLPRRARLGLRRRAAVRARRRATARPTT